MRPSARALLVFGLASASVPFSPVPSLASQKSPSAVEFPVQTLRLARRKIRAEIADTPLARERGLMFRTELKDGRGMLFVYDEEQTLAFWMKNTLIPLSIGFFDADRALVDVQEMEPASAADLRPPSYRSARPAKYALEMPKGWFAKNKIPMGAKLVFSSRRR